MTHTDPRAVTLGPQQPLPRLAASVLVLVLTAVAFVAISAVTREPASAGRLGVVDYSPVDTALDPATCADLGRVWATRRGQTGCQRVRCLRAGATIAGDYNTESCRLGGSDYAVSLESRLCRRLDRRWIGAVNRCLANVDRSTPRNLFHDARQCRAPATTYVVIKARDGIDLCVTPTELQAARRTAAVRGIRLPDAVLARSEVLCATRASYQWSGRTCRALRPGEEKHKLTDRVFVIGDSVTWRAADEIARRHPTWAVDGRPGSALNSWTPRFESYLGTHTMPRTVVLALGTNGTRTTRQDYLDALRLVPARTRVVLVTPYRDPAVYGQRRADLMTDIGHWMSEIVADRPHTCLAPWQVTATTRPDLLVDGVHQQRSAERTWATLVARAASSCS